MAKLSRVIDLDIDIGADAVDYKFRSFFPLGLYARPVLTFFIHSSSAIANQESLSGLETEMRKLEGIVKEVVDEMTYLRKREERFTKTNGALVPYPLPPFLSILTRFVRIDESTRTELWLVYYPIACWPGRMANIPPSCVLQAEISYRLILNLSVGGMLDYPCVHAIAAGIHCI